MPCSQSDVPNFDAIKASKMWNQTLPAWRPMFTPKYVIASLLLLGPVFVALGVHIRETSRSVRLSPRGIPSASTRLAADASRYAQRR
jgi:hypothetical protein